MDKAYDTDGFLVNSGKFDGLTSGEAREAITKKIEEWESETARSTTV